MPTAKRCVRCCSRTGGRADPLLRLLLLLLLLLLLPLLMLLTPLVFVAAYFFIATVVPICALWREKTALKRHYNVNRPYSAYCHC